MDNPKYTSELALRSLRQWVIETFKEFVAAGCDMQTALALTRLVIEMATPAESHNLLVRSFWPYYRLRPELDEA